MPEPQASVTLHQPPADEPRFEVIGTIPDSAFQALAALLLAAAEAEGEDDATR